MEEPRFVYIEPRDRIHKDAPMVRSISPLPIILPQKQSPWEGSADHHNIEREWKTLQTLRERIRGLRGNMEQLSDQLRQIQDKQLEADNIYLSLVRRKRVAGEILDQEIEDAFERLEASRLEYSDVDATLESLRKPLNAAEHEQMRMEHRFYNNLEKLSHPGGQVHWKSPAVSVSSSRSSRYYGPQKTYHPLWDDYLKKLGVVERLEEEYAELENWKVELTDEKEIRRGIGKTLLSEDEEFLVRFPAEAENLLTMLQTAKKDLEKAKVTSIEAGVWRDGSSSSEQSSLNDEYEAPSELSFDQLLPEQGSKIMGSQGAREQGEDMEASIALEHTSNTEEQSATVTSRSPSKFLEAAPNNTNGLSDGFLDYIWDKKTSTGNYVNLWLLHRLQSSLIEFGLLFREAEPWRTPSGDTLWQGNIVSHWFNDGTAKLVSATITDPDSNSSIKLPPQHPFLNWDTKTTSSLSKCTAEAVMDSQLARYFDSLVYSARIQPKGLLLSTTKPSLQHVDFSHSFLLENKAEEKREAGLKTAVIERPPDIVYLGNLPFPFGTRKVYLRGNLYRNLCFDFAA